VTQSQWTERPGGLRYTVQANRFLHHMVRFLVGTMLDIASGRRPLADMETLLAARDNKEVSPPVAPHGLFLESVEYPPELYLES
jgi:tRNA pseudouridine38-40 synthase